MPARNPSRPGGEKCHVKVSEHMGRLRDEQGALNAFLWSSELCYSFALSSRDPRLSDGGAFASDALQDVASQAWHPSAAGPYHYNAKINLFRRHLQQNQSLVCQATAMMWYSKFELYLTSRLRPIVNRKSWGPFTRTLAMPALTGATTPLQAVTVLRADLCRHVRNAMTHERQLPEGTDHDSIRGWIAARCKERGTTPFCESILAIRKAAADVVGQAVRAVRKADAKDKALSLAFFYALFSLTNFDALALEIEEALVPDDAPDAVTVKRQRRRVRRD